MTADRVKFFFFFFHFLSFLALLVFINRLFHVNYCVFMGFVCQIIPGMYLLLCVFNYIMYGVSCNSCFKGFLFALLQVF